MEHHRVKGWIHKWTIYNVPVPHCCLLEMSKPCYCELWLHPSVNHVKLGRKFRYQDTIISNWRKMVSADTQTIMWAAINCVKPFKPILTGKLKNYMFSWVIRRDQGLFLNYWERYKMTKSFTIEFELQKVIVKITK